MGIPTSRKLLKALLPAAIALCVAGGPGQSTVISVNSSTLAADVVANNGLTSSISAGITTLGLAPISATTLLANTSTGAAIPTGVTLSSLLDNLLTSTRGALIERGSGGWTWVLPGLAGNPFLSSGSGADPAYGLLTGSGIGWAGVTSTNVSFLSSSQVKGTGTNDSAPTGYVGEYSSSAVGSGSQVLLACGTQSNITLISLSPGDWDVWFTATYSGGASLTLNSLQTSISMVSSTVDSADPSVSTYYATPGTLQFSNGFFSQLAGPARKSISATSTVYAVVIPQCGVSSPSAFGILRARRVR